MLLQLAESREKILALEAKVSALEKSARPVTMVAVESGPITIENLIPQLAEVDLAIDEPVSPTSEPPPLPPKSASINKNKAAHKPPSAQVNR